LRANADFFNRNQFRSDKQSNFTSKYFYNKSMEAYSTLEEKHKKIEKLHRRRQKLGDLLFKEREAFKVELKNIRSTGSSRPQTIEELRERAESIKSAREEKRKQIAEEKLYEHWKENNADLQLLARNLHKKNVIEAWGEQNQARIQENLSREVEEREFANDYEKARLEAVERLKAEEERKFAKEKERVEALKQQMIEVKEREREARELRAEQETIQEEMRKMQVIEDEREKMEARRKNTQLKRFLHHQYKAQMLRRSQQIQEELEMDRQILENMKIEEDRRNSIENERIKRVKNDVEFMKEEVRRQMKMNRERDEEMDILYREEARRMWQKREEEWGRERNARKKLMDQVLNERREQMETRSEKIREKQRELIEEREELLEEIEINQKSSRLDREEAEKKKMQRRLELEEMVELRRNEKETARREELEMEKRRDERDEKMKEMYREEEENMRGRGHNDKIFSRRRTAWE